jgi:retron-type reverse transcriptase
MKKTDSIKLNMLGLPVIQSLDDFSMITHISNYTIYQLSFHSEKYYKTYDILKKSGKLRAINQPSRKLKGLQAWILVNILNKLKVSDSCKGFEKNSSTLNNAVPHKGANAVLSMDLMDFFPTITSLQVFNIFKAVGYNNKISSILSHICTYKGYLPQGSPCSPKLANLSAWNLDLRIQGFVGKRGINYTRYADDLTFSSLNPSKVVKVIPMIRTIIEDEDFKVNNSKTRISGSARAKIVTGLIISGDSIGVGKQKYKCLRAKIHHLTLPANQNNTKLFFEVRGWLSYLNHVDKRRSLKTNKYIEELSKKYSNSLVVNLIK